MTPAARSNSLAQKLVQLTMPGVPDVYQGTELWEDSLVDPDNRRPVDFAARGRAAGRARRRRAAPPAIDDFGRAKLWLVSRTLRLRRDRPDLFDGYRPSWRTGRPPTTCSPSTAAAPSPSRPGGRSLWPARAASATTTLDLDGDATSTS